MKKKKYLMIFKLLWIVSLSFNIKAADLQGRGGIIDYFEVHEAKVQSVCKQLSAFSGVDIIVSDKVTTTVSISLSKKTWREILEIICKTHNLIVSNEGSYLYVVSKDELEKNNTISQAVLESAPLKREIIKIKHVNAEELAKSIQNLLSSKGKITVVAHTNALIVYDTEENISQIKNMVSQLDIETAQISISCKIIEVSSGVIQKLGIHWGYTDVRAGVEAEHMPPQNVIAGALDKITYGIISPQNLSAALEYLYGDNKGEIIAQPQITTVDNKEARIFMGQEVPIKYLDEAGNTVVKMIKAGTELVVKPHISGNGRILLELSPKKESYVRQPDGTPVINQQSATTNVVVNNGETVVIAGLTSNEESVTEEGIPILKDIPLLGNLFKRSSKNRDKKDLVIFVTPYIINSGIAAAATEAIKEQK
ncbi:MAG: hypothetical protein N2053_06715 [Chitinispirillaceae bacterium]|nr:hypothetical protein [Chitinispirillaceae bacterium]